MTYLWIISHLFRIRIKNADNFYLDEYITIQANQKTSLFDFECYRVLV